MTPKNSRLVYSTEHGRIKSTDSQSNLPPPSDGIVRITRETKGRKGKGVSIINGLALPPAELKELAKTLKQVCGTGGTVKNNVIELQGDHREKLADYLKKAGYTVKLAGG